jgi:hypothetical protein
LIGTGAASTITPMPMQPRLPRGDEKRDAALDLALREVVPGQGAMERADQPDGFITGML